MYKYDSSKTALNLWNRFFLHCNTIKVFIYCHLLTVSVGPCTLFTNESVWRMFFNDTDTAENKAVFASAVCFLAQWKPSRVCEHATVVTWPSSVYCPQTPRLNRKGSTIKADTAVFVSHQRTQKTCWNIIKLSVQYAI